MLQLDDDETSVVKESEIEYLLNSMHYSLLLENIKDQINNPFTIKDVNFLEVYEDRYKYLKIQYEGNDDFISQLKAERKETYGQLLETIGNLFGFEIDKEDVDVSSTIKVLYDFFILRYPYNIEVFLRNYIIKNKKTLVSELENRKRNKDVSTVTAKKKFKDINDALVIANLPYIINSVVCNLEDMGDGFLKYIVESDDYYVYTEINKIFIKKCLVNYTDSLFLKFLNPVITKQDGYTLILINVQNYLFEKYTVSNNVFNII